MGWAGLSSLGLLELPAPPPSSPTAASAPPCPLIPLSPSADQGCTSIQEGENVISLLLRIELQRTNHILPSSYMSFIKAAEGSPTLGAEVIHQNDLLDEVRRRAAEDAVHRAQQGGPHLVHKAHDDAGAREVVVDLLLGAPATATRAHRGQSPSQSLQLLFLGEWAGRGKRPA